MVQKRFTAPLLWNANKSNVDTSGSPKSDSPPNETLKTKPIKLLYFTDPICSTCWLLEPYLSKFLNNYGHLIDIEYKMGGLIADFGDLQFPNITEKKEVFLGRMWDSLSKKYGLSLNGDIWLRSGVKSSWPACIAFYAVKMQKPAVATSFYRSIRENLFLHGQDISEESVLTKIAIDNEVDLPAFFAALHQGEALAAFERDLADKKTWGITRFPSFVFSNQNGDSIIEANFMKKNDGTDVCERWEDILQKLLPDFTPKKAEERSIINLLEKYNGLSLAELCILSDKSDEELKSELHQAFSKGLVIKEVHKNQDFWRYNQTGLCVKKQPFQLKDAAIIGGGISGFAMALSLTQHGVKTSLFERNSPDRDSGFGFLLLKNGIDAIDTLGLKHELLEKANPINFFKAFLPNGELIVTKTLDNCLAISRQELIDIFKQKIEPSQIFYNKKVTNITKNGDKSIDSIHFEDGTHVKSEIFIGADGIKSTLRQHLFTNTKLSAVGEKEIVRMAHIPNLNLEKDEFIKTIDCKTGKSMGIVPLGNNNYVWFLQVNNQTHPVKENTPEYLFEYTLNTVKNYPPAFKSLVEKTDFNKVFLWASERMDALPAFHSNNTVLIGDAAHPLLALTSQGANSALEDIAELSCLLSSQTDKEPLETVFNTYYKNRIDVIRYYINEGDMLVNNFLRLSENEDFKIPLALH